MSNNNGSRLQRSEEMGVEGDSLLKSLIDEIQNLRGIVNPLKQEVKMLQDQLAESGKLIKDKFSIVDLYDSPDYKDQKFNVAAMTIILHKKNAQEWQRADLEDCHQIFERIHDDAHYLGFAKTKERIVNKDGSLSNSFLMVLRKYLVLGAECSAAQGKEIQRLLFKMFVPLGKSTEGEQSTARIDPVRQSFRKFIAEISFGRLVNPHIPRQTGLTTQDYHTRIEIIAEQIRKLFFGAPKTDSFSCLRADGSSRRVELPTKEVIVEEIKQKYSDREWAEMRYVKSYLKVFDAYELARGKEEVEEEDYHERSRPVIEVWRDTQKLKGYIVLDNDGAPKRKGHGRGKAKLFQFECITTPPSFRRDVSNGLSTNSSGSSQLTNSSTITSSQSTSSSSSSNISGRPGYSLSSSSSSLSASKKRPFNSSNIDYFPQECFSGSKQNPEHLYDNLDEDEEDDEYAHPSRLGAPSSKLQRQGRDKEAKYVRIFQEDKDAGEERASDMEVEEEEEDTEEESQYPKMLGDDE